MRLTVGLIAKNLSSLRKPLGGIPVRAHHSKPPGGIAKVVGMSTAITGETRGYTATKEQLLKRLRRIQGQVGGIERMIEDDRYCIEVMTQISAVQAALDKVALGLLDDHARHCVVGGPDTKKEERTEELMAAVGRLMRRG